MNRYRIIQSLVLADAAGIGWLKSMLFATAIIISIHGTNAFGAHITLATDFSVSVKPDGLALAVMAENQGDVPAHDVQFEVILDNKVLAGTVVQKLAVNEKTSVNFPLADVFGIPGRYAVVIRTNYKDAAGHSFSALRVGFYNYQSSSVSPLVSISGHATGIAVDGKGRVNFVLRNDGQTGQKIELALFIPNEFSVSQEYSVVEIGSQQEETLVYEVENYSALANSRYQVSLVGRYEENGYRFSVAGSAVIRVTGDAKVAGRPVWVWVLLGGLVPVVIIFLRLKKQWK